MSTMYKDKIRKRTIFALLAATFVLIGLFVADVYMRFSANSRLQLTLNKTLETEYLIDVLTDKRADFINSIQLLAHSPSEKNANGVVAAADAMVTATDTIVRDSPYDTLLKRMADKLARQTHYFREQVRQRVEYRTPGAFNKDTLLQVFVSSDAQEVLRICINDCYYALKELRKQQIARELEKLNQAFTRWIFIVSIIAIGLLLLGLITLKALKGKIQATNEVKETRNLLRGLIDHSGSPMYVKNLNGQYLLVNNKFAEGFGSATAGLLGKRIEDITSDPGLIRASALTDQAVIRTGKAMNLDAYTLPGSTGKPRTYISTKFPLFDAAGKVYAIGGVGIDITERVIREKELEESKKRTEESSLLLKGFLENAATPMFIKDLEGRYLVTNKKKNEYLPITKPVLTGYTHAETLADTSRNQNVIDEDTLVINERRAFEYCETIRKDDGSIRYYITLKFPISDGNDNIFAIGGITTDITDSVIREAELSEAKKQAEKARAAQQIFLANMSHEMRTPLNGIIGLVNLLQLTRLSDEQEDFLASLKIVSNSLLALINGILDISKIQAGKLNIESIVFHPGELLDHINRSFKYEAERKGLQFILEASPNVPEYLVGDPTRLNQILINLIGNAIKFTHKGFVKLKINVERTTGNAVKIIFVVQDTGIGISPEKQELIFDSFSQASQDTARQFGGTGLGLTICKELIIIQHGEMAVSSKLNEGTSFWFYIPYQIGEGQPALPGDPAPDEKFDRNSLPALRCLIVEDNLINQKVAFHTLEKAGVRADIAGNGLEALQKIKEFGKYDFIIMDIQMPEMDGYETTRVIRSELNLKELPIIAMTASALKGEKERCQAAGMNDYIPKPFTIDELFAKIRLYTSPAWKEQLVWQGPTQNTHEGIPDIDEKEKLFDLAPLRQMGDDRFLLEILNMFLGTVPDNLYEIQNLIASGTDWDAIAQKAHKLKSSIGIMQMHSISQYISAIEQRAKKREDTDMLPQLIEKCQEAFCQVRPDIETVRNDLQSKLQG